MAFPGTWQSPGWGADFHFGTPPQRLQPITGALLWPPPPQQIALTMAGCGPRTPQAMKLHYE